MSSRRVRRFLKKTGMRDAWRLHEAELLDQRSDLRKQYRKIRRTAPELRYAFQEQLAQALAKAKNSTVRHERKRIVQKAKQRETAARQRRARGKQHSGGLTQIEVPTGLDQEVEQRYESVGIQPLVEQGCIAENVSRFNQTVHPLVSPNAIDGIRGIHGA